MTTSECKVVAVLGDAIARRIGEPRYRLWFDGKTKFNWDGGQLVVGVPNHFYQEWLQKKFAGDVRAAAVELLGQEMEVRFAIDGELFREARKKEQDSEGKAHEPRPVGEEASGPRPVAVEHQSSQAVTKRIRRWHQLKDFVVGPCNRLAHASALHVVEAPCHGANPLVLHGPVGTGKTHLLEGIYVGLRREHPEWRVSFVTAEDFTNRFVQTMRLGKLAGFRKQFRECDALLVDDVHFLARKQATQEEFLHTFDALQAEGKQVVLTSDCHPRLAEEFSPELADRLVGGAVWGLVPPEEETRLEILRAKSAAAQPPVPEEVLRVLAGQLRGNVRELEGALHSLRHWSKVHGRPIEVGLAREALADLFRHAIRVVQLADIDRSVCQVLGLESGALQSKQRSWVASHPRMLAIYLARRHTRSAYSEIGTHFGGRNHSTAVAAEKKVRRWLDEDGELMLGKNRLRVRDLIERVERQLKK